MIWGRESILQAPILLPQAIWVAARAARLPEPEGPRSGQIGQGPDLRLLILGDSSAAGVGADHQSAALSGRLVHHLAPDFRVDWTLQAKSGATARTALVMLEDQPDAPMDAVVLVLGVNDAKNGVRHASWRERCEALLDLIAQKCAQPLVFVSGVPPLGEFPILPNPLRRVLGHRAAQFDTILREVAKTKGALHLPIDLPLEAGDMASDGFHPGPPLYEIWGQGIAASIRKHIA